VALTAVAGKFAGCTLAARWSGMGWREGACIGALMNTRGLMELVVANVGRDLGVINEGVNWPLELMALLTTLMTGPLLAWLTPGTELEAPLRAAAVGESALEKGGPLA
jgi:Kef-type K+ transport system membrane component KefB